MTVENPNAIDMVTERDGGRLTLVIQVPLTWSDGGQAQLDQLVAKVNAYIGWVKSGACERAYPSAAGGVDFLISCLDDPVGDADRLVVSLRNTLVSQFGIGLFFLSSFPGQ